MWALTLRVLSGVVHLVLLTLLSLVPYHPLGQKGNTIIAFSGEDTDKKVLSNRGFLLSSLVCVQSSCSRSPNLGRVLSLLLTYRQNALRSVLVLLERSCSNSLQSFRVFSIRLSMSAVRSITSSDPDKC